MLKLPTKFVVGDRVRSISAFTVKSPAGRDYDLIISADELGVVELVDSRTVFGQLFVIYHVRWDESGELAPVRNGHCLLERAELA